ncbi:MAG: tRNA (guanosine(37)-N1)-methyltransferase TrmD [Bacillales bacterium]|jgi:tRNA (guanine37-N1)-methyltransferase|nr:tRNA (guanosine(37)-N1)-methyltransferase TrmD [Bacillales bacterium]
MIIDILTLFPKMFEDFLQTSIIGRAITNNKLQVNIINIRDFSNDKNKRVDDYIFGGGPGLLMKVQPLLKALNYLKKENSHVVLLSPRGKTYNQNKAKELLKIEHLILICGHYEGIDERFFKYIDEFISIGDYILTGGEIPAMAIVDSLSRLIKGVINDESSVSESFEDNLLEYPQYTFPRVIDGDKVPEILLSGNEAGIRKWRKKKSLELTIKYREDLINKRGLSESDLKLLNEDEKWMDEIIHKAKKIINKE